MPTVVNLVHATGLYLPSWSALVAEKLTITLPGVIFEMV